MVWEQKTKAIVMLNGLVERGANKCNQYWPSSQPGAQAFPEPVVTQMNELQLSVELISQVHKECFVIRKCLLTDLQVRH